MDIKALEYIPEGLRQEPLFRNFAELLDVATAHDFKPEISQDIHPAIAALLGDYDDIEAVMAYHNVFIKPSLGTKSALVYVLNLLKIDAELIEWFEADFNLPSFKFVLDFESYPDGLDIDKLLRLIRAVKNERSALAVIRQPEAFQDLFVLDYSYLDDSLLSDVSGYNYEGVNIHLVQRRAAQIDLSAETSYELMHVQMVGENIDLSLEADWILDGGPILGNTELTVPVELLRSTINIAHVVLEPTTATYDISWNGATHFMLSESALSDGHILAETWWDYTENLRYDNPLTVMGELDQDLVLSEMPMELVFRNLFIEQYTSGIDISAKSAFNPVVSQTHRTTSSEAVDLSGVSIEPFSAHTTVFGENKLIVRYSIGPSDGSPSDYKPSAHSNHRSEPA